MRLGKKLKVVQHQYWIACVLAGVFITLCCLIDTAIYTLLVIINSNWTFAYSYNQ